MLRAMEFVFNCKTMLNCQLSVVFYWRKNNFTNERILSIARIKSFEGNSELRVVVVLIGRIDANARIWLAHDIARLWFADIRRHVTAERRISCHYFWVGMVVPVWSCYYFFIFNIYININFKLLIIIIE